MSNTEYREKSSTCSCCGGHIPAGKIRWVRGGECPGHITRGGNCGAIDAILRPALWWRKLHRPA